MQPQATRGTSPQYTIRLSRDEITYGTKYRGITYTVTDTGQVQTILSPSDDNAESAGILIAVDYGQRHTPAYDAPQMVRRHLDHAWRETQGTETETTGEYEACRDLLIAMARELYEHDPCALADLLAEAYERGTRDDADLSPEPPKIPYEYDGDRNNFLPDEDFPANCQHNYDADGNCDCPACAVPF